MSNNDDDDFADPVHRKIRRNCKSSITALGDGFPSIETRGLPAQLIKTFANFNDNQRSSVREMGFGDLLDIQITDTPPKLGYWLVDNYHPFSQTLRISNKDDVHLTEVDVEAVMGFPRGPIEMTRKPPTVLGELIMKWRAIFHKRDGHITPSEVCLVMERERDGGFVVQEAFCNACGFYFYRHSGEWILQPPIHASL